MRYPHFLVSFIVAAVALGCERAETPEPAPVAAAPEAAAPAVPRYSAEAFFQTTSYGMVGGEGHAFSPDGTALLVSSDKTGVFNAYRLPVDGSDAVALTDSDDNAVFAVSWFPHDERILYTYDGGGNELNHIVVREIDGKTMQIMRESDILAIIS